LIQLFTKTSIDVLVELLPEIVAKNNLDYNSCGEAFEVLARRVVAEHE